MCQKVIQGHFIEWACKSQRHVTRSTFSAELLGAGDTADQAILVSHMIYELEHGPISITQARQLRMEGGYIPIGLYLDAMSVYAATTATFVKQPAERSLLSHVQYLRELLDKRILEMLFWIDTRDMGADGLTKGAVLREALHQLMAGTMTLQHEFSHWHPKVREGRPADLYLETKEETPAVRMLGDESTSCDSFRCVFWKQVSVSMPGASQSNVLSQPCFSTALSSVCTSSVCYSSALPSMSAPAASPVQPTASPQAKSMPGATYKAPAPTQGLQEGRPADLQTNPQAATTSKAKAMVTVFPWAKASSPADVMGSHSVSPDDVKVDLESDFGEI